ncbi:MAG: DeoR/GlpR family DNA-binding transcription regulator [Parvibaculaceae bacterium]
MQPASRNPARRRSEIRRLLLTRETMSVEDLSQALSASPATIRRDLAALERSEGIQRTHGGAVVPGVRPAEQDFAFREGQDVAEKRAIAQAAVALIAPGSTVFMNDGSTIMAVAKAIVASGLDVFVATPAVNVATKLAENPRATVCLLGGFVRHTSLATTGPFTETMAAQINADMAFISSDGLSAESGLTFTHAADAALAKCMVAHSARVIAVTVTPKIGRNERITAVPASDVDEVLTGCADDAKLDSLKAAGLAIRRVSVPPGSAA